jgi:hypothetical protein
MKISIAFFRNLTVSLVAVFVFPFHSLAQSGFEPEVRGIGEVTSPYDEGLRNTIAFNVILNNFGFGVGGEYRRSLSRFGEGVLQLQITGLKDITEQTYQFFGREIIPDKRNRVLAFPIMLGYKHRFFARPVSDNYRVYAMVKGGPTFAYAYPYYQLRDVQWVTVENIPLIDSNPQVVQFGPLEAITGQINNDIFQGWGDGEWFMGTAGEVSIGVDAGEDFKNLVSVRIGFTFQYFNKGIQVMDKYRVLGLTGPTPEQANIFVVEAANDKQKLFTSPFLTLTFGGLW